MTTGYLAKYSSEVRGSSVQMYNCTYVPEMRKSRVKKRDIHKRI